MSRGNMLLGMASGKVGDVVFYRSNGQQQTRSKAASVKNPRTMAQSTQRVLMKNVVLAYSALKSICDHSFQNVQYGAASQRKFMRDNLDKMRTVAAATNGGWERMPGLVPVGGSGFPAFEFLVSQGSMPQVSVSCNENYMVLKAGGADSHLTYQAVCDQLGLKRGDQLTFVGIYGDSQNYEFKVARVILDPYTEGQPADMSVLMCDGTSSIKNPNPDNQGYLHPGAVALDGTVFALTQSISAGNLIACTIIASRKEGAAWLRSEQNLVISNYGIQLNNTLGNNAAQASAGTLTIDVDDPYYLNGAEQAVGNNANYAPYAQITRVIAGENETNIPNTGTTNVTISNGDMSIKIAAVFKDNKVVAAKKNNGAWTVLYTVVAGDGLLKVLLEGLTTDDLIQVAVGTASNGSFTAESIWGGTIKAVAG